MRAPQAPMTVPEPTPAEEAARLRALDGYDVLDSAPEDAFDRIARLVRTIFGVPFAFVSLIDAHRQWHKAALGLPRGEVQARDSFCRVTIGHQVPLIVPDAVADPRFALSRYVQGEPHIRAYAGAPLRTPEGHNIGSVCAVDVQPREFGEHEGRILADLAGVTMDLLEARKLAATDSLTSLATRRTFRQSAIEAVALARRHMEDASLVAFDLDHFKSINDTYGHAAGDAVLVAVADLCRRHLRETDIVGRMGGEEFAVLLPKTDLSGARKVAELLRSSMQQLRFEFDGKPVTLTGSFGVAGLGREDDTLEAIMTKADLALYESKRGGRNRCTVHALAGPATRRPRRRVLKAGQILTDLRGAREDCTIRTLADDGAGIDVADALSIPDRFRLAVRAEGFETDCRVVARTGRHLEVAFDRSGAAFATGVHRDAT